MDSIIRNKTMHELPGGTLFPDTMKQYDDYTIREALSDCSHGLARGSSQNQ